MITVEFLHCSKVSFLILSFKVPCALLSFAFVHKQICLSSCFLSCNTNSSYLCATFIVPMKSLHWGTSSMDILFCMDSWSQSLKGIVLQEKCVWLSFVIPLPDILFQSCVILRFQLSKGLRDDHISSTETLLFNCRCYENFTVKNSERQTTEELMCA